ncbi:hypothetical protein [Spiroplasma poulsonii]|uniref:hypothetical protein n=1 Tax=Spiroplasma poulsonii TaxID=2138 RepID=UPI001F53FF43|nr:hypothetical protein [Spiroplasma poulsonii]
MLNAKTLSFSYFKEKLDVKVYNNKLYKQATKILKENYDNRIDDIDFIYIAYQMTELLGEGLRSIFSRKLSEVTR